MPDDKKPALDEPKKADERPRGAQDRKPIKEAPVKAEPSEAELAAAKLAQDNRPLRTPDEWAAATGRVRKAKVTTSVNGTAQKDRTQAGEHTAAARLHRWGRSDVTPRDITREDYEAAIRATKRAPEGQQTPVPHPGALFASIFPES